MNGVYFDIDLEKTSYVGTDGSRLAMVELPASYTRKERAGFILSEQVCKIAFQSGSGRLLGIGSKSELELMFKFDFDSYRLCVPNDRRTISQLSSGHSSKSVQESSSKKK